MVSCTINSFGDHYIQSILKVSTQENTEKSILNVQQSIFKLDMLRILRPFSQYFLAEYFIFHPVSTLKVSIHAIPLATFLQELLHDEHYAKIAKKVHHNASGEPILEHIVKSSDSENDCRSPPSTLHTCESILWEKAAVSPLKGPWHEVSASHCEVLMPKGETPTPQHAMHHPGIMMAENNAGKTLSKKILDPSMGDALPLPAARKTDFHHGPLCIHVMCSHMCHMDSQLVCYWPSSSSCWLNLMAKTSLSVQPSWMYIDLSLFAYWWSYQINVSILTDAVIWLLTQLCEWGCWWSSIKLFCWMHADHYFPLLNEETHDEMTARMIWAGHLWDWTPQQMHSALPLHGNPHIYSLC